MAIFRKKAQASNVSDSKANAIAADRQAKWDELERLVSASHSEETTTPDIETVAPVTQTEIEPMDIPSSIETALRADIPSSAESIDVTPPESNFEDIAALAPSDHFEDSNALNFTPAPPSVSRADRADLGSMRLDVARISADIQSGEELYRRAQQRIENLTNFVEKAEIDFSLLGRLEPENRRLKARNRTIEREFDSQSKKMDVLRRDLEDHERRLQEKSRLYETTQSKLTQAQKSLQEYERALNTARETADRNALQAERAQTSLDVERKENEHLRIRVTEAVADVELKQTNFIEARKIADSLAQDCADYRHQAEEAQKDADELRKALATAQTQNNAMKVEMISLHEDIRTFKTQSEFNIISREDELTALHQQVDNLKKQLEIKDDIVRNAARDVTELRKIRTAQDLERERLEAQIDTQAFQLEEAQAELLKTKQDVTDFDRRYRDVATALNVAQSRRMSNEPVETPDIQPAPRSEFIYDPDLTAEDLRPKTPDEFDGMSEDDIEDRIMDFRLGLRDEIT